MAKEKNTTEKKEILVKFSDKIEVVGKGGRLKAEKVYTLHPVHAEKLVNSGQATYKN